MLILVGELLAVVFVVMSRGLERLDWVYFGSVSFLVQWIILSSAACLCPLRSWFREQNGIISGSVSYGIVLLLTLVFTLAGQWVNGVPLSESAITLTENFIIAAIFAGVVLRSFYLQQQLHNREQAELQSRIQALRSRIRPHFLFNSMNSIASLIDIDPKAAEKMVIDLSQLFRVSLSEAAFVKLEDEIKLCKQFISIEQTRLGSRLSVDWQTEITDTNVHVPSLLLQPLIENAIYHGIQPLPEGGEVKVEVSTVSNEVRVMVSNPVVEPPQGIDDKRTAKTPAQKQGQKQSQNNGIALENIQHRLEAHFGGDAVLDFTHTEKEFCVELRYPITATDVPNAHP